jgi:hypothetical protein
MCAFASSYPDFVFLCQIADWIYSSPIIPLVGHLAKTWNNFRLVVSPPRIIWSRTYLLNLINKWRRFDHANFFFRTFTRLRTEETNWVFGIKSLGLVCEDIKVAHRFAVCLTSRYSSAWLSKLVTKLLLGCKWWQSHNTTGSNCLSVIRAKIWTPFHDIFNVFWKINTLNYLINCF